MILLSVPRGSSAGARDEGALTAAVVALLLALPAFPALLDSYGVTIFTLIFFYGFLGQSWNIVGGYAGQLSAGHAAFVGVGRLHLRRAVDAVRAHAVDRHVRRRALAAVLATVIGYLGFRFGLRGFYFVLLTVAFAEVCRIVALNTDALGGALGLYITFTGNPRQFQFQDSRVYYYVALALMLRRDRRGVRSSSGGASASTSPPSARTRTPARRSASTRSGTRCSRWCCRPSSTGIGGTFYAFYLFSLQPNAVFGIPLSVEIIIRPIVGGAGTLLRSDHRLVHPDARSP